MHEIESQRAALPPVPASTVKDQLNDDWAQQYIQDGRNFLVNNNHEEVWAEIHAQEQIEHNAEKLWTNDFLQQKKEAEELHENASSLINIMDDQQFQNSKVKSFKMVQQNLLMLWCQIKTEIVITKLAIVGKLKLVDFDLQKSTDFSKFSDLDEMIKKIMRYFFS